MFYGRKTATLKTNSVHIYSGDYRIVLAKLIKNLFAKFNVGYYKFTLKQGNYLYNYEVLKLLARYYTIHI